LIPHPAVTELPLPAEGPPVAAIGGDLKCAPCVTCDRRAVLGPDLGDLEHPAAADRAPQVLDDLAARLGARPRLLVHDLHPDYHGTRLARRLAHERGLPTLAVQHHHAHALACAVDAAHDGPALALTLDGAGYGADGTPWGGELLAVHGLDCQRLAHLTPLPLPGGDRASREPWRMALAAIHHAGGPPPDDHPLWRAAGHDRARATWRLLDGPLPRSSSAGRLFDAVASLLDVRHVVESEGQAAIELEERAAHARENEPLASFELRNGPLLQLDPTPTLRALQERRAAGAPAEELAQAFHRCLADALVSAACTARDRTGLTTIALTGGVMANRLLLGDLTDHLRRHRFAILRHRRSPPGDASLALGQAWAGILHLRG